MTPSASSLYATDSALSSYAVNNGVYLNGFNAGWLSCSADGTQYDNIRIYGGGFGSYPHTIAFTTNNSERMRIDSSGNVLLNTTSIYSEGLLNIGFNGQAKEAIVMRDTNATLNGSYVYFQNSAGSNAGNIAHTGPTTVAYNTTSDYRLKENIAPMTGALDKVSALKPVTYTWKNTDNEVGEGFIAHELQEVCPLAVTGEKDAVNEDGSIKAQGIDTAKIVGLLTAAIQELNAKVTALEAQLGAK
jgi:hypothetical protein